MRPSPAEYDPRSWALALVAGLLAAPAMATPAAPLATAGHPGWARTLTRVEALSSRGRVQAALDLLVPHLTRSPRDRVSASRVAASLAYRALEPTRFLGPWDQGRMGSLQPGTEATALAATELRLQLGREDATEALGARLQLASPEERGRLLQLLPRLPPGPERAGLVDLARAQLGPREFTARIQVAELLAAQGRTEAAGACLADGLEAALGVPLLSGAEAPASIADLSEHPLMGLARSALLLAPGATSAGMLTRLEGLPLSPGAAWVRQAMAGGLLGRLLEPGTTPLPFLEQARRRLRCLEQSRSSRPLSRLELALVARLLGQPEMARHLLAELTAGEEIQREELLWRRIGAEVAALSLPPPGQQAPAPAPPEAPEQLGEPERFKALVTALQALEAGGDQGSDRETVLSLLREVPSDRHLLGAWASHVENHPRLSSLLPDFWIRTGRPGRARWAVETAARRAPLDPEVRLRAARALLHANEPGDALPHALASLRLRGWQPHPESTAALARVSASLEDPSLLLRAHRLWLVEAADPDPVARGLLEVCRTMGAEAQAATLLAELGIELPEDLAD